MPGQKKSSSNTKRSKLPRTCSYTKEFEKAWERYNRAGMRDMNEAKEVMGLLFKAKPVPERCRDHELSHEWEGHRELHVGGDFLLIYKLNEKENTLVFTAIGSHSELFD